MKEEMKEIGALTPRDATVATAQHTPGPWLVRRGHRGSTDIFNADNAFVCTVGKNGDTIEADARLIAAAPDFEQGARAFAEYEKASVAGNDEAAMLHYANASRLLHAALAKASQAAVSTGEANPPPQGSAP